jgi:hypothetical protein
LKGTDFWQMDVLQSGFEALVDGMYNRNKLDDRVETSWVISRVPPRCKNIKKMVWRSRSKYWMKPKKGGIENLRSPTLVPTG